MHESYLKMKSIYKNKKNKFFEKNWKIILYIIIGFSAILKSLMFFKNPDLWWDSASYIGIGKYIWTFGEIGFWNPVRPLVLSTFLGFIWKIGLDPIIWGRILQIIAASLSVYFIYKVSFRLFNNNKISLLSALFLSIDPIIFTNTQHLLTSTLAMTFSLISVNYFLKSKNQRHEKSLNIKRKTFLSHNDYSNKYLIISGVFASLAFLTRLTFIFIGISIGLIILLDKLKIKDKMIKASYFSLAFLLVWLPYLILNLILYKNPLYPYLRGLYEIGLAGTAIDYPLTYYLTSLPKVSSITILSVIGIYLLIKNFKKENNLLLLFLFFFGFLYHMFLVDVKVLRYTILFLPFLYIITSYSIINISKTRLVKILVVLLIIISINQNFIAGTNNGYSYSILAFLKYGQTQNQNFLENNFYDYFDKSEFYGAQVLSSSPYPLAYSDIKFASFFFPNKLVLDEFEAKNETFYVMISLIDNYCDPKMEFCQRQQEESNEAYDYILLNYKKLYNVSTAGNNYFVFKNS